jgi:hypothetical protein
MDHSHMDHGHMGHDMPGMDHGAAKCNMNVSYFQHDHISFARNPQD